jgi:glycosyltransferase involved in cell wall biosynthesis
MNFSEVDPAKQTGVSESFSTSDQFATDRRRSISIIFPAFNEEENIRKAVEHGRSAMSKFFTDIEIIVVNDGSSDATASIVDEMAAQHGDVVPVHHEVNRGYGAALRSGIYKASKELIFFTD